MLRKLRLRQNNDFLIKKTCISLIIWVTQQKYQLLQVSPIIIENLISGGSNESGVVGKFFEQTKRGRGHLHDLNSLGAP